jgi:hypothetical protein
MGGFFSDKLPRQFRPITVATVSHSIAEAARNHPELRIWRALWQAIPRRDPHLMPQIRHALYGELQNGDYKLQSGNRSEVDKLHIKVYWAFIPKWTSDYLEYYYTGQKYKQERESTWGKTMRSHLFGF